MRLRNGVGGMAGGGRGELGGGRELAQGHRLLLRDLGKVPSVSVCLPGGRARRVAWPASLMLPRALIRISKSPVLTAHWAQSCFSGGGRPGWRGGGR